MAELTTLDEKLAEVLGLAQAAQTATKKVATLARKEEETALTALMQQMGEQALEIEKRCEVVAGTRNGMRTAINVAGLVKFALPIQKRHVDAVREHSLRLAAAEDPAEIA